MYIIICTAVSTSRLRNWCVDDRSVVQGAALGARNTAADRQCTAHAKTNSNPMYCTQAPCIGIGGKL